MGMSLDQITVAADDVRRRQQAESVAQMSKEIARIQDEDWKAPEGVDLEPARTYSAPLPLDYWLRLACDKHKDELGDLLDHAKTGEPVSTNGDEG